jgi:hypothetical protein
MFIFIWPNCVIVKYIIDYKVKFLRYTGIYKSGRRRGMIFEIFRMYCTISFCFVSQITYSVSFRFLVYTFCFVSSCFVSFLTLQGPVILSSNVIENMLIVFSPHFFQLCIANKSHNAIEIPLLFTHFRAMQIIWARRQWMISFN